MGYVAISALLFSVLKNASVGVSFHRNKPVTIVPKAGKLTRKLNPLHEPGPSNLQLRDKVRMKYFKYVL